MTSYTIKSLCNSTLRLVLTPSKDLIHMQLSDPKNMNQYEGNYVINGNYTGFTQMLEASISLVDGFSYKCKIIDDRVVHFIISSKYLDDIMVEFTQENINPNQKLIKRIINLEKKVELIEVSEQKNFLQFDMPHQGRNMSGNNTMYELIDEYLQKINPDYVEMITNPENIKNITKNEVGEYVLENRHVKYSPVCHQNSLIEPNTPRWNVCLFIMWRMIDIPSECPTKRIVCWEFENMTRCGHQKYQVCESCRKETNDLIKTNPCLCVDSMSKGLNPCNLKNSCSVVRDFTKKNISLYDLEGRSRFMMNCNGLGMLYNGDKRDDSNTFGKLYHIKYYELALNALSYSGIHADSYTNPYDTFISVVRNKTVRYRFRFKIYRIVNEKFLDYDTLVREEPHLDDIWYISEVCREYKQVGAVIVHQKIQLMIYKESIECSDPPAYS